MAGVADALAAHGKTGPACARDDKSIIWLIADGWGLKAALLARSVVSLARADLEIFLQRADLNTAISPIGIEIRWVIRNYILTAEFVLNCREGVFDVLHLEGEEGTPTGGGREFFEILVSAKHQTAIVGGNRVNNDFGALRHFDCLR